MHRVLVTGSSGHLGEALIRTLAERGVAAVGLDVRPSPWTDVVAPATDAVSVRTAMRDVDVVIHTASLPMSQLAAMSPHAFVDVNVGGTLTVLDAAVAAGVNAFAMTSSTTVFGDAPALHRSADSLCRPCSVSGRRAGGHSPTRSSASTTTAGPATSWVEYTQQK